MPYRPRGTGWSAHHYGRKEPECTCPTGAGGRDFAAYVAWLERGCSNPQHELTELEGGGEHSRRVAARAVAHVTGTLVFTEAS